MSAFPKSLNNTLVTTTGHDDLLSTIKKSIFLTYHKYLQKNFF